MTTVCTTSSSQRYVTFVTLHFNKKISLDIIFVEQLDDSYVDFQFQKFKVARITDILYDKYCGIMQLHTTLLHEGKIFLQLCESTILWTLDSLNIMIMCCCHNLVKMFCWWGVEYWVIFEFDLFHCVVCLCLAGGGICYFLLKYLV